jgi:hypothetical protein
VFRIAIAHVQRAPVQRTALPPGSFPGSGMRFDAVLATVGKAPFLLSLRGEMSAWLSEGRPMRFQAGHLMLPLARAFDVVVYFENATPAARAK